VNWRLALILLGACGGNNSATLGGAGMAAAGGVVQTAIYRKVTGYPCWAKCQAGDYCDLEAGSCTRIPCGGKCKATQRCDKHGEIEECIEATHKEQVPADEEMCAVPDASIVLRVPCDAGRD
jgi:hypothetical protein